MASAADIANHVDRLMRRIEAGVHEQAHVMDAEKIGPFGGMVLLTLAEIEPAPVQTLVRLMARDKSQMTRVIQALESKSVIERQPSPSDGRVSLLSVTPKGYVFIGEVQRILTSVIDDVLRPLPKTERAKLASILEKINRTEPETAGKQGPNRVDTAEG